MEDFGKVGYKLERTSNDDSLLFKSDITKQHFDNIK